MIRLLLALAGGFVVGRFTSSTTLQPASDTNAQPATDQPCTVSDARLKEILQSLKRDQIDAMIGDKYEIRTRPESDPLYTKRNEVRTNVLQYLPAPLSQDIAVKLVNFNADELETMNQFAINNKLGKPIDASMKTKVLAIKNKFKLLS